MVFLYCFSCKIWLSIQICDWYACACGVLFCIVLCCVCLWPSLSVIVVVQQLFTHLAALRLFNFHGSLPCIDTKFCQSSPAPIFIPNATPISIQNIEWMIVNLFRPLFCLKTEEVFIYNESCQNGSPDVIHHVLHIHTAFGAVVWFFCRFFR